MARNIPKITTRKFLRRNPFLKVATTLYFKKDLSAFVEAKVLKKELRELPQKDCSFQQRYLLSTCVVNFLVAFYSLQVTASDFRNGKG